MSTTDQPMGTVLHDGERWGLRYERLLRHPPDKVWAGLTESEHLEHWMPCDIVGERREGAAIELPFWPAQVERYAIENRSCTGRSWCATPTRLSSGRGTPTCFGGIWKRLLKGLS